MLKMKKPAINILSVLLFQLLLQLPGTSFAVNAPVTTAPHVTGNSGQQITIPITVEDFNNIGAVSLLMNYDPTVLSFISATNNSAFPGLIIFNPVPGSIVVSGYLTNPNGFSLSDGAIFYSLKFTYLGGLSALMWYDDGSSCEYTGPSPQYLPLNDIPTSSYYINGSVSALYQSLSGVVTYYTFPGPGTPMPGMTVNLKNNQHLTLATAVTNAAGQYNFEDIPAGASRLEVISPYLWGGVNATDALAIQKRTVGLPVAFWLPEAFLDKVADVNISGSINSTDALFVMQRSVQLITSFAAGDWAFYAQETNFTNTAANAAWMDYNGFYQIDIKVLCYGDVNGSYSPVQPGALFNLLPGTQEGKAYPNIERSFPDSGYSSGGNNGIGCLPSIQENDEINYKAINRGMNTCWEHPQNNANEPLLFIRK